jgi:hypothetical protein
MFVPLLINTNNPAEPEKKFIMLAQMSDTLTDDLLVSHDDCILLSSYYMYIGPTPITIRRIIERKELRSQVSINYTQLFLGKNKIIELGRRKNVTGNAASSDAEIFREMNIRHHRLMEFDDLPKGLRRTGNVNYDRLNRELRRIQPYSIDLTRDELHEIELADSYSLQLEENERLERAFRSRTRNLNAFLVV